MTLGRHIPSSAILKRVETIFPNVVTTLASAWPVEDLETCQNPFLNEQSVDASFADVAIYGVLSALGSSTKDASLQSQ